MKLFVTIKASENGPEPLIETRIATSPELATGHLLELFGESAEDTITILKGREDELFAEPSPDDPWDLADRLSLDEGPWFFVEEHELAEVMPLPPFMTIHGDAAELQKHVKDQAAAAAFTHSSYADKCKRRRTDGPTPCLCCPGECTG